MNYLVDLVLLVVAFVNLVGVAVVVALELAHRYSVSTWLR